MKVPRPRDFYGPEDYIDGMDVDDEMQRIRDRQAMWDQQYAALPWWRKIIVSFTGEL